LSAIKQWPTDVNKVCDDTLLVVVSFGFSNKVLFL